MFDFVGKRFWFLLFSTIIVIPCIISLAVAGLKPGIEFRSGTTMTLAFSTEVNETQLRTALADMGYSNTVIQHTSDNDFIVRMEQINNEQNSLLISALDGSLDTVTDQKEFATVSQTVAAETVRNAIIAVISASVGIMLYITFAFRRMPKPFRWGICAIIALVHNVLVVTGIFSILGWAAGVEIDALFITGMLTVVGYSVHDTIVVFDRIRENMLRSSGKFENVVNASILQTLTRSIITPITLIFVLLALFILGGATIRYFTLVLIIGCITGTYSSIFNASQILVIWENKEWSRLIPFRKRVDSQV
ncbi:MAG: protein translocase subunit SecF [Dehalococcoidia bacterium]|nr:protein translocase subunit SecF [Dehalococcoidia bacterium]